MNFTFRHMKPYGARVALYVVLVVLSVVFTMATALSVADFLKILFDDTGEAHVTSGNLIAQWLEGLYIWLISFGRLKALLLFSAIIFVLYGLKNVFTYLSVIQIFSIQTHVVRDLRNDMFRKAMRLPVAYYDRNRKGDILSRFSNDITEYEEHVLNALQALLTSGISLVLYLAMLVYLNVKLTLFVLCMLPIVAIVISGISHRLKRQSKEVQERSAYLLSLTDETVSGLKVIKSYTAIDFSNRRFREYNRRYTRLRTAMYRRIDLASPVSDFLGNAIVIGILLFGASLVMGGDQGLTSELFISYIMLFVLMIPPTKELSTAVSKMKKGRACTDRIEAFLDEQEEPAGGTLHPAEGQQSVEFRHVGFAYNEGVPVLHDINLTIPRGTTMAIVGSSGSGKSTMADLVCRYYDCTGGEILLSGIPIREMPLAELRSRIGVVSQDTLLFNDTVRANIAFGRPDATDEEIRQAARIAQADDFIRALPDGYDTNIGEGGGLLSGGQRQRISIARALLRNPELLIFDEATSALDTESEHQLQQTIGTLLGGRTAIVIAHRLSTVRTADCITVLDHGRIVEQGTHDQLMARGGRYSQLVALQAL